MESVVVEAGEDWREEMENEKMGLEEAEQGCFADGIAETQWIA